MTSTAQPGDETSEARRPLSGERTGAEGTTPAVGRAPARWQLDPARCEIAFTATRRGATWVDGAFPLLHGTLALDWDDPLATELEGEVDIRSLSPRSARLNTEARTRDLLEPERNRSIGFQARAVERLGASAVRALVTLTIGRHSRELPFELVYLGARETPAARDGQAGEGAPERETRARLAASAELRRSDVDPRGRGPTLSVVDGGIVHVAVALEAFRPA